MHRVFSLAIVMVILVSANADAGEKVRVLARGAGKYRPNETLTGGKWTTIGSVRPGGRTQGNGELTTTPTSPTTLTFEGTAQQVIGKDGSIDVEYQGTVELSPRPGGKFIAVWKTNFKIVGGSGKYAGASGTLNTTATNSPFSLTDPVWNFRWTQKGYIITD